MSLLRFAEPHVYTSTDDSIVLWISGRGRGVGSKVFDLSKKSNHGIIYGATWVNALVGHSVLSFDGVDDYVDCGNDKSLNITERITVEVWVKDSGYANESRYDVVVSKGEYSSYTPYAIFRRYEVGEFEFFLGNGDSYIELVVAGLGTKWSHLVGTYDNGVAKLYLNGELKRTGSLLPPLQVNSQTVKCGGGYTDRFFNGLIGEVRIYNRALTAREIRELYNKTKHLFSH